MRRNLRADSHGHAQAVALASVPNRKREKRNFPMRYAKLVISNRCSRLALLVTYTGTCPKVLFTSANQIVMIVKYAQPLFLPASRKKPRHASRRFVRSRVRSCGQPASRHLRWRAISATREPTSIGRRFRRPQLPPRRDYRGVAFRLLPPGLRPDQAQRIHSCTFALTAKALCDCRKTIERACLRSYFQTPADASSCSPMAKELTPRPSQ